MGKPYKKNIKDFTDADYQKAMKIQDKRNKATQKALDDYVKWAQNPAKAASIGLNNHSLFR